MGNSDSRADAAGEREWTAEEILSLYARTKEGYEKTIKCYEKKAATGDEEAQYKLGMLHYKADGMPRDYEKALQKVQTSVDDDAPTKLSPIYGSDGACGLETAAAYFKEAAEHGHIMAQYFLGRMIEKGEGVEQSDEEALAWLQKAVTEYDQAQPAIDRILAKQRAARLGLKRDGKSNFARIMQLYRGEAEEDGRILSKEERLAELRKLAGTSEQGEGDAVEPHAPKEEEPKEVDLDAENDNERLSMAIMQLYFGNVQKDDRPLRTEERYAELRRLVGLPDKRGDDEEPPHQDAAVETEAPHAQREEEEEEEEEEGEVEVEVDLDADDEEEAAAAAADVEEQQEEQQEQQEAADVEEQQEQQGKQEQEEPGPEKGKIKETEGDEKAEEEEEEEEEEELVKAWEEEDEVEQREGEEWEIEEVK
jgi:TPR repeat protein